MACTGSTIPLCFDARPPGQFSKAGELNVLAYANLKVIHKSWLAHSDGAIVFQPVRLLADVINESLGVNDKNTVNKVKTSEETVNIAPLWVAHFVESNLETRIALGERPTLP